MIHPAHHVFEIEALNDIFCHTEDTTREFLAAIGHLYAQKPHNTRIYSLVITAMELGFKLGSSMAEERGTNPERML